jgi:D-cysteine desulfhydrase
MIRNILNNIPRLNLSVLPTPIQKLEKLSSYLSCNIYCMRDDLTGFALGGNKTRKLDYLIADALAQHTDTIIAVGANQSNFCRIAAAYGKANGLEVHLVLAGKKPKKATGNLKLDHLFGAIIHHVDSEDEEIIAREARKLEQELSNKGKNVYYLPMGGSIPMGTLGYIHAFDEILIFSKNNNISFSSIILASGSGGTQAGLVLGKSISKWNGKIIGMSVGKNSNKLFDVVNNLCHETIDKFSLQIEKLDIKTEDAYTGKKYGARTKEAAEAIKLFANLEGIVLDEVYTGKAAAGLIDFANKGRFNRNDNILFIHTGGFVQLFE